MFDTNRTSFTPDMTIIEATTFSEQFDVIRRHHPIGASTGFMSDDRGDWPKLIENGLEFSRFAIEMSALSEPELGPLRTFIESSAPYPFDYVSIHGPSKNIRSTDAELIKQLLQLERHCESIVMHPDTMSDFAAYRVMGRLLVIENMDQRKSDGRTLDELAAVFEALPDAGFCLDVAHAWSVDPTMQLAHELLDAFGDRLRQVHVSSLTAELRHTPLEPIQMGCFSPVLRRCRDVPWIFEAALPSSSIEP